MSILPYLAWFYTLAAISMFVGGFLLRDRMKRRTPRTLIATRMIPIEASAIDYRPMGLHHVIDGVKLRDRDLVVLTRQDDPSGNGWWIASNGPWSRPNGISFVVSAGSWAVPTDGRQAGVLWLHQSYDNRWVPMDHGQNSRLLSYHDSNICPDSPLEAAAFLLRLGLGPARVQGSRDSFVRSLVRNSEITEAQGDLLLAKPDNLTNHVPSADGGRVQIQGTWTGQVYEYMLSLQSTYARFLESQQTPEAPLVTPIFTRHEVVGFKRIVGSRSYLERLCIVSVGLG
jgi:hypothetical protein